MIRLYRNGADVCRKELAIHDLLSRTIRVPRVLHAEPDGIGDSPAFLVNEYVKASTFRELTRTKDLKAIQQASHSVGATLATISTRNVAVLAHEVSGIADRYNCFMTFEASGYGKLWH